MNLLRLFASAALVTSLGSLAVACSSKVSDGSTSVDGACADYATAVRSYLTKCFGNAAGFDEARLKEVCASGLTLNGTSITPQFLSSCSGALKELSCDSQFGDVAACEPAPGKLAAGAACVSDEQCSTSYCKQSESSCGVCTAATAVGGDCSTGNKCVSGASCLSGKCVAEVKNPAGGSCDSSKNESCQAGLFCDFSTRTCKTYVGLGGACSFSAPCQRDLQCDNTSKTCVKATLANEGEACSISGTRCATGLACDPMTSKCAKIKVVAPGGDCSGTFTRCEQGSCDEVTNKCPMIIADGGACTPGDGSRVCNFGAECVDGKCLLPAQIVCK